MGIPNNVWPLFDNLWPSPPRDWGWGRILVGKGCVEGSEEGSEEGGRGGFIIFIGQTHRQFFSIRPTKGLNLVVWTGIILTYCMYNHVEGPRRDFCPPPINFFHFFFFFFQSGSLQLVMYIFFPLAVLPTLKRPTQTPIKGSKLSYKRKINGFFLKFKKTKRS